MVVECGIKLNIKIYSTAFIFSNSEALIVWSQLSHDACIMFPNCYIMHNINCHEEEGITMKFL